MSPQIISYIMSGGIGSRLWPLSREDNPKQFHDLAGGGSMITKTVSRLRARAGDASPIYLIGSARHAVRVSSIVDPAELAGGGHLFEPVGRNTAAAVALAVAQTLDRHGDQLILILPSDHEISTPGQFWQTIEAGVDEALAGRIIVFGIPPTHPETGYGYIEAGSPRSAVHDVKRFVEKPDIETARSYLETGGFFWNAGIFLFRASAMRAAFELHQPDIWKDTLAAYEAATNGDLGVTLPAALYGKIRSDSIDFAIMEKLGDIGMVPAAFKWSDLGSWQSLLDVGACDNNGNIIQGDVIALDCRNSYIRGDGVLLSAIGLDGVVAVATPDATFMAPVSQSQSVKKIVEHLDRGGRSEHRFTPSPDGRLAAGTSRRRVKNWLMDTALPFWSRSGVDHEHGGFFEALDLEGRSLDKPKRMRTMARQIYAFATGKLLGWDGPADELVANGIAFLSRNGRTDRGGWVKVLDRDGSVADPTEHAYDHACVLLALAQAHACGHKDAAALTEETFGFLDSHLAAPLGYFESPAATEERTSNSHMHLLEAFLAWHDVTGDAIHLDRASRIAEAFEAKLFDAERWAVGEFFDGNLDPAPGERGTWTEPGHHFEWTHLLLDLDRRVSRPSLRRAARRLYATAVANGEDRSTGRCYGVISKDGDLVSRPSRSWPQTEGIKAAIALHQAGILDLGTEIEDRVATLFRWHIDPAPAGMWIDSVEALDRGSAEVPASILYHLVFALGCYLNIPE